MEWCKEELEWLDQNRGLVESGNLGEIRNELVMSPLLNPNQVRHLFLGLAVVMDLPIIIEIKQSLRSGLFIEEFNPRVKVSTSYYTDIPGEANLIKDYSSDLKSFGLSPSLIGEVINKAKIRRVE